MNKDMWSGVAAVVLVGGGFPAFWGLCHLISWLAG